MLFARFALIVPLLCAAADRPPEVEALVDRARGVPAEFSADALIRVAGLEKLDKTWRIELLEEAFRRAASAQQPVRRRPAVFRFDGQSGYLERTYAQELDGMSLQMRAIEALLPLDRAKARELFMDVVPPRLSRLGCKDNLVYDVSRFYAVLGKVAGQTFSAEEIQEEEHFKLLMRYASVASPAQIGPMAEVLAEAKLTDAQFQGLVATFAASLKQMNADDRSFTAARPSGLAIKRLRDAVTSRGGSPVPLLEAYRAYLVRHLTAARCADTNRMEVLFSIESVPSAISEGQAAANAGPYFNDTLRVDPIPPLTVEEQTPALNEGEAVGLKGCDSPECVAIGKLHRALVLAPNQLARKSEEKNTPVWQAQLKEMLSAVADWKQDTGRTAAEHFRFKMTTYSDLLALAPAGPSRDAVLGATHQFLQQSRLETENRLEWFLPVNLLLGRVLIDPAGLGKFGEEMVASGDAIISLYAQLDRVAPRGPEKVVSLF